MLASQRHFSEKNACALMSQILSAVEYCHKNKVVHRDLKPENCVFAGKGIDSQLKIIDFGRSRILKSDNLSDVVGSVIFNQSITAYQ
jgi:calcium-dependent protein kinase